MKERPILFSAPMVRAILDGSKTQTRRVVKPSPEKDQMLQMVVGSSGHHYVMDQTPIAYPETRRIRWDCPHGQPSDRLWVRENGWERPERTPKMMREGADTWSPYYFDADGLTEQDSADFKAWGFKRRPNIHMPRWASRITLEITGVRVERLQDISDADLAAEGIQELIDKGVDHDGTPLDTYRVLWESLHGPDSWDANPWVWVVDFQPIDAATSAAVSL